MVGRVKFIIFQGRDCKTPNDDEVHSGIHQEAGSEEHLEDMLRMLVSEAWEYEGDEEKIKYIRVKLVILRNGIVDRETHNGFNNEKKLLRFQYTPGFIDFW